MQNEGNKSISDKQYLTNLLFETDKSLNEIAVSMGLSYNELNSLLKKLGLYWIKDHRRKTSKGQTILTNIVKKLLPGINIVNEFHVGEKLRLDVYCPKYKLGIEFHGIQHFKYSPLFFDSKEKFLEAKKRDERKIELCKQQGIVLVVFRYNDNLSEESVYDRILDAIRASSTEEDQKKFKKPSIKENKNYQKAKKIRSENNKKFYKQLKEQRRNARRSK